MPGRLRLRWSGRAGNRLPELLGGHEAVSGTPRLCATTAAALGAARSAHFIACPRETRGPRRDAGGDDAEEVRLRSATDAVPRAPHKGSSARVPTWTGGLQLPWAQRDCGSSRSAEHVKFGCSGKAYWERRYFYTGIQTLSERCRHALRMLAAAFGLPRSASLAEVASQSL